MKLGLVALALGVLPALGQVESVAVYTSFHQAPPEAVFDSMKEEVAAIMSPGGIRLDWRSLDGVKGSEVFSELAVAKFQGNCDPSGLSPAHSDPGALAWSHVSDGEVLPFTDVDCDRIWEFLRRNLAGLEIKNREKVFGRAMGRVLAHELYHIFARAQAHGSRDVDRPAYTVSMLVADEFGFDESKYHVLQVTKPPAPAKDKSGRAQSQAGAAVFARNGCTTCHGSRGQGTRHGPALRTSGLLMDSVVLAAKLDRGGPKMCKRAPLPRRFIWRFRGRPL